MNLYLDTSTPEAILVLEDTQTGATFEYRELLGREMAEKLLGFLRDKLAIHAKTWTDLKQLTFFSGPGSFTGLRIGATVINTLAHELRLPLYDHHGVKHSQIIPDYGRPARVTPPKK
ncbi:tRNA (adenosine(37)-N6)-threonylcarbamoyltransferase complex dimerization subunit type 1 TsaB [Candidatus Saccharibacteria bacterium]|nr:tRNA (adenosine(37)-N6)-threonylcarbamoyltransferase complex dimerization subunit type 1 TsaB [Candidatus Saccharibacteria bacterium]